MGVSDIGRSILSTETRAQSTNLRLCGCKSSGDILPVRELPDRVDVVGSDVLVLEVVPKAGGLRQAFAKLILSPSLVFRPTVSEQIVLRGIRTVSILFQAKLH